MSTVRRCRPFVFVVALFLLLSPCPRVTLSSCRAFDAVIDVPMYRVPDLPMPRQETIFPDEAKDLWLAALERPEADMRCQAAGAIALAQRRGVKGMESTVPSLRAALDRPDQPPTVRLAVAQALIALDARDAAPSLFAQAQAGDSELHELVEPALARWDYRPARAVWLERLRDAATPQRRLILAIHGLGTVREEQAGDRLRERVLSERVPGSIRLEAARALAELRTEGLEPDAERLAADASAQGLVPRLAAASLLRRHRSEAAIRLLQRLAGDPEPTVATAAVEHLLEINPDHVLPAVEHLLAGPDAGLRSLAVEVLFQRPTEKNVGRLGDRLDDLHPDVRVKARQRLRELAGKGELRAQVIAQGEKMLATRQWRGLEQATILLTQLDHKPAAQRLVALLEFDRPEVFITAAWGLRKLAVRETLPAVAHYSEAELGRLLAGKELPSRKDVSAAIIDHQLSQLNQFLGEQKHRPADPVLRQFIPKRPNQVPPEGRAAAIWALGLIHEGETVADLAKALEERLNDTTTLPPEDTRVRRMCAITLGRVKAQETLPSLRKYYPDRKPSMSDVNNACGWAIQQITGEAMPPPETIRAPRRDWFLVPNR